MAVQTGTLNPRTTLNPDWDIITYLHHADMIMPKNGSPSRARLSGGSKPSICANLPARRRWFHIFVPRLWRSRQLQEAPVLAANARSNYCGVPYAGVVETRSAHEARVTFGDGFVEQALVFRVCLVFRCSSPNARHRIFRAGRRGSASQPNKNWPAAERGGSAAHLAGAIELRDDDHPHAPFGSQRDE